MIDCYSDTDWSGCGRTRKSTSGGCLMHGRHTLKTWSTTQPSVTLSSGEAEFYGVVRAAGAALGQESLMQDLGLKTKVRVWTDSSAAMGISTRSGLGKLRHLETHTLWVQGKIKNKAFELRKVRGEVNPADLFTKHLTSRDRVRNLTELFSCSFRDGRSAAAPLLRKKDASTVPAHAPDDEDMECDMFDTELKDAELHDANMLPHLHSPEDIERLFPIIHAADSPYDLDDWFPEETYYGHGAPTTSAATPVASTGFSTSSAPRIATGATTSAAQAGPPRVADDITASGTASTSCASARATAGSSATARPPEEPPRRHRVREAEHIAGGLLRRAQARARDMRPST